MRKISILAAGFLLTLIASAGMSVGRGSQNGPWEPIGPSGGMIGSMAVHPSQTDRLVAVTQNYPFGIFLSSDSGQSWRHLYNTRSWSRFQISFDPFDPATIFLLQDKDLLTTTDEGKIWTLRPLPAHFEGTGALVADRSAPGVLYAAARRFITSPPNFDGAAMAVLKSTDRGLTWTGTTLSAASYLARTLTLAQDPSDPKVLYAGGGTSDASGSLARLFRSPDSGATWVPLTAPEAFNVFSIIVDPSDSRHLLVGTDRGIYHTRDGGATWTMALPSAYVWRMAFDPGDPSLVYAGANDGFFKSGDGGATWQAGPAGVIKSGSTGLIAYAPGRLFVSSQAGIRHSPDSGATWTNRMNGIRASAVNGVGVAPSAPNVVYFAGFYGEMFRSTDFGESITQLPFPQPTALVSNIEVNPADPNDLYVRGNGILRSRDGGQTWMQLLTNCTDFTVSRADFNRLSAVGTVSENNGDSTRIVYFASADGVATWASRTIIDRPPRPTWSTSLAVNPVDPNTVYVGLNFADSAPAWEASVTGGFVLKSVDGGATWAETAQWLETNISALTADPAAPGYLYLAASDGIYRSQDGGLTWRKTANVGAGLAREFEFNPLDPREIWVGLYDDAYFSLDKGETWARTYGWDFSPYLTQMDFSQDGTLLYAGTWNTGAFRMKRSGGGFSAQVRGTVRTAAGAPIPGVLLSLTNNPTQTLTDTTGSYALSVPLGWSGTLTPSAGGWIFAPANRAFGPVFADATGQDFSGAPAPTIGLSRTRLNFGAAAGGPQTPAQSLRVFNAGAGTLNWTAAALAPWLGVSPAAGTGAGSVVVGAHPTGLSPGSYAGTVGFAAPGASNSPREVEVRLTVIEQASDRPPFGNLDTPLDGSSVAGSVAVTGWALDDIEVTRVEVKREPIAGDPPSAIGPDGLVFIGKAVFVPDARSDVRAAFPDTPQNHRAGWGYMLLTNMLPNGGNGTFVLHAVASDGAGHSTRLGRATVEADNANAVAPFGAIDTPAQGGTASGPAYSNFGWVLTPWPKEILRDGSTITVFVDGLPLGHPTYNLFRQDIFDLFPGYSNRDGAVGHFVLDTTKYADGLHTIAWGVTDNAGVPSGIGSRFFTIQNGLAAAGEGEAQLAGLDGEPAPGLLLETDGASELDVEELEFVKRAFRSPSGMKVIGWGETSGLGLPVGSTLDPETGVFSWIPGPGFLGRQVLHFAATDGRRVGPPVKVTVRISPRDYRKSALGRKDPVQRDR